MQAGRFLKYLQFEKRFSPLTVKSYENDLAQFFMYLEAQYGKTELEDITHFFIRSWIVSLMDAKITNKSISRKISTLRSFFRFLMKEQVVTQNPMLKIIAPKIPKRLPEFVSKENMENLFMNDVFEKGYEGIRDKLVIELFYATGMRRAELVGLKNSSIDFGNDTIKVLGKRNKERIVPMAPSLVTLLKQYQLDRSNFLKDNDKKSEFLILDNHCNQIYDKLVYRIVKKRLSAVTTSKKKSPHVLRHTFATHMLNNGADINVIKEILGHSSLAATQVYTHNTIDKLKKIYKQAHPKA